MWKSLREKVILVFCLCIGCITVISCTSTSKFATNKNTDFQYLPGYPHASVTAFGYYSENKQPQILIITEVIPSSFVSIQEDSSNSKKYSFEIFYNIENQKTNNTLTYSESKSFRNRKNGRFNNRKRVQYSKNVSLKQPGAYDISVIVKDNNSGKSSTENTKLRIPPTNKKLQFTNILLKGEENSWSPITTYNISQSFQALSFESQLVGKTASDSVTIRSRLIKFDSDLLPADKLSAPPFAIGSLQQQGIDYTDKKVVFNKQRTIQPTKTPFKYKVESGPLKIGNYRCIFEVTSKSNKLIHSQAIDFGVRRAGFPYVTKPIHMAKSMYYLMDKDSYNSLLENNDPKSLKQAIDDFWLTHINDSKQATQTIKSYFSRVEEANKYFTNYKAGWKTDRGMIYILFGPPIFTATFGRKVRWAYSSDQYDPSTTYWFKETRQESRIFPFSLYILDRSNDLLRENEYLIIKKWLNGNIPTY